MLNTPEYLIVHHTGGTNANPLADTSHHTFEMVKQYHLSLGWEDIGYHFFINKAGEVTPGRNENYHGAHTIGYNSKSLGICLAGNFDATLPTKEQENSLQALLEMLQKKYKIPRENIVPHREFANKTCYGRRLADDWAQKLLSPISQKPVLLAKIEELKKLVEQLPE